MNERASAWLEWNRSAEAAECLDGAALSATVEAGLNRTVFVPAERADLRIKVYLDRPEQDQWTAAIDLEDPNGKKLGHRELKTHAPQCSAIEESLALVVSLMVDVTRESVRPKPATIQQVVQHLITMTAAPRHPHSSQCSFDRCHSSARKRDRVCSFLEAPVLGNCQDWAEAFPWLANWDRRMGGSYW